MVLSVTHEAANNLGTQAAQVLRATDIEQGSYRNHFQAVPPPRAGTEVLVDFVDGDIDRPIVVGQLHNGQHDLPRPAVWMHRSRRQPVGGG